MIARGAAAVALWMALCGVQGWPSQPVDLMPKAGRAMPFGKQAVLTLREADHDKPVPFGTRPAMVSAPDDRPIIWRLRWAGGHYDVINPDPKAEIQFLSRLAVRRLPGSPTLHVAQLLEESEEMVTYSYRLVLRQPDGSFIYFHDNGECHAVPAAVLARIFPQPGDRSACRVRSWRQVEALLTAFAATGPQPFGVAEATPVPP